MMANAENFLQGSQPRAGLGHSIFKQSFHAIEPRLSSDRLYRFAVKSHFPNEVGHAQQLKNAFSTSVASLMAIRTTTSSGKSCLGSLFRRQPCRFYFCFRWLVRFLAFGTNNSHQALSHNGNNRRCYQERLDPDILQTCNSARRIVRMKCAENQVSCQRSLHRGLCCLMIAYFSNQNYVGSLAKHGPDDPSKIQANIGPYFGLVDSRKIILNRIFSRNDLSIRSV